MGGAPDSPKDQTQTIIQDLPEWSKPYWTGAAASAKRVASKPYEQYRGKRVSDFDPMELQALGGVQDLYDAGARKELGAATGIASDVARKGLNVAQWDGQAYQRFADPYLEEVLAPGRERLQREYQQAMGQGLRGATDEGIQAGIVGGRSNILGGRVAKGISDAAFTGMREYEAEGRGRAYDAAQEGFFRQQELAQAGAGQALDAGTQLQNIADMQQSQAFQRIEALKNSGLTKRELDQRIKDIAYEDHLAKKDWQRQQLNWFVSLLSGTPYNATQSTQTTSGGGVSGPSTGQTLGGLGIAALGAYGASQAKV